MAIIEFPLLYVPDPLKGRPLFNCQIFVGIEDLDPEVVGNQKQLNVIQEDGTVVSVNQPFVTSAGGVPTYNGKTVLLDVDGNYSLKILDNLGVQKYYVQNVVSGTPITTATLEGFVAPIIDTQLINDISQTYNCTVAEYKALTFLFPVGKTVYLTDREARFTVVSGSVGANDSYIIASDKVAQSVTMTLKGWLSYESFGALGDGLQQDAPFMALAHASGHRFIYGKPGSVYLHDGTPSYLEGGTTIMLSNSTVKFAAGVYTDHMFIYKTNDDITYNAATPRKTNINIYDGFVDGNTASITLAGKGAAALRAQNVDGVTWHNPNVKNMPGDTGVYAAIAFFFSSNCDVINPTIINTDRQGIMFWESTGSVNGGSIGVSRVREPILISSENVVAYQGAHAIIDDVNCNNVGTTSGTHVIRFSGKSSGVIQNCDLTGDNATNGATDLDGVYVTFAADHDVTVRNNDIRNCNKGLKVDSVGYKTISSLGNRYWSSVDAIEYNASGVDDHFTTSGDKLYDTVTQPLSIGFCDHVVIEDVYIRGGAQNNFISNFETLVIDGMKVNGMTSASNSVSIDGSGTPQAYLPQIDGLSMWGNTVDTVNVGENAFMINTNGAITGNGIPLIREGDAYKWRDTTGDIRTSFTEPLKANRNTAGVIVGTQT